MTDPQMAAYRAAGRSAGQAALRAALRGRWATDFAALGWTPPPELGQALLRAWSEPGRAHHGLLHLTETLAWVDAAGLTPLEAARARLGLWFHDAIYDPKRSDNEAASARWAKEALSQAGLPLETVERVAALVMATAQHGAPDGPDAAGLLDADLSILGAPLPRYQQYEHGIAQEYAWVPEAVYRRERARILQHFLEQPTLFYTQAGQRLTAQARKNLTWALQQLASENPLVPPL